MKIFLHPVIVIAVGILPLCLSAAEDDVLKNDHAATVALQNGNTAAAQKLMDPDFSWIDTDGVMRVEADAFRAGLKPLLPEDSTIDVTEHKYGKVVWVQKHQGDKYTAHFWVQRPNGWRLLHITEIRVRPAQENPAVRANFAIPCVNPCKELPYTAISESEKGAVAGWQEQELSPEDWDRHIPASNVAVSTYGAMTKEFRKAGQQRAIAAGVPKQGAAPVLWLRTWDFGDAVVMIACQPTYGGKAYWSSRVLAHQNGLWQMAESYQNTIQASPVMNVVQQNPK